MQKGLCSAEGAAAQGWLQAAPGREPRARGGRAWGHGGDLPGPLSRAALLPRARGVGMAQGCSLRDQEGVQAGSGLWPRRRSPASSACSPTRLPAKVVQATVHFFTRLRFVKIISWWKLKGCRPGSVAQAACPGHPHGLWQGWRRGRPSCGFTPWNVLGRGTKA